ncbi:G2/mitotic-specific cyclin-B [Xylariomycetidae sp. FL2044]|nr:G2/mitotic-specific cyclin-B [Xylariomycetidae sp. FL2044]
MPPRITGRSRPVSNENDENSNSTRLTRAKAAALEVDVSSQPTKQPLQSKKSAVNANPAAQRKRTALTDMSNVGKADAVEGKKPLGGKAGLVSKAAQPTGVQKSTTRNNATRTVLSTKETKKSEVKRAGSGSGAIGAIRQKRKVVTTSVKQGSVTEEDEPVRKKMHTSESEQMKPESTSSKLSKLDDIAEQTLDEPESELEPELLEEGPEVVLYPPGVKDLDTEDLDDPYMVAEYANEIFEYLRELELKSIPNAEYMQHQDDLEWKTRGILIDWLIEVHTRFHLLPETLFLTVNIIDRFLSEKVVQLDRLQLVGITAMFIASKYEEVLSPHVGNFRHVTDDGFTEAEILSAERFILQTLNYDLSYPNPLNFLRRISKADNYDIQSRTMGKYLMEIGLLDHRLMGYAPSLVTAAGMYMSRLIFDHGEWDETLAFYAGYTEDELIPVFRLMVDYLARPVIHEAFYKKYASRKFSKVSLIARNWARKHAPMLGITDTKLSLDDLSS